MKLHWHQPNRLCVPQSERHSEYNLCVNIYHKYYEALGVPKWVRVN